jgi:hypothetical protein
VNYYYLILMCLVFPKTLLKEAKFHLYSHSWVTWKRLPGVLSDGANVIVTSGLKYLRRPCYIYKVSCLFLRQCLTVSLTLTSNSQFSCLQTPEY